jgi:murein DD-endopeptidase MepM/ murein hydrolase activator NlpD
MKKEQEPMSRRSVIKMVGLGFGTVATIPLKDTLFPRIPPENPTHTLTEWPTLNKESLPRELSTILKSTPDMHIDREGYLKCKDFDGTWSRIDFAQTLFNKENSNARDRLRTDVPWAIVLHWVGGKYDSLQNYVTRGFDGIRNVGEGVYTSTSAHVLVGEKAPQPSKDGLDKPLTIAQIQKPDTNGVPFRAAHLAPINWEKYIKEDNWRWYPVNAMNDLQRKLYPGFHSVLQDIYDGVHISPDKRTLGIEIGGAFFDKTPPSTQTTANVLATVCVLMKAYKIPAWDVIGHYEIQPGKGDPGKEYLSTIRFLLGIKALQEPDKELKELVFGNFINGKDYRKAARDYFDSVRKYLLLTSRPDVVSSWEGKIKFWFVYDSLFSEKNDMPIADSLRSPIEGKDIKTGLGFLKVRDDGGYHTGYDYNLENDAGKPTFLIGNAKCIYAGNLGMGFGNTAIFRLRTPDGADYIVRYLHLEKLPSVTGGEIYKKGKVVGRIGKSGRQLSEHLHLDIAPISTYEEIGPPGFRLNLWPSATTRMSRVKEQFIDPDVFISKYPEIPKNVFRFIE